MGIDAFSLNSGEKLITELPIVRFKIENTSYGFDVSRVLEILRFEPITRVPNVADQFQGVINLRGQIIPIINLRKRFSMPNISKTKSTRILIITYGNETVGIIVDRVQEVVNVLINRIIPKPRYFQNKVESLFFQGLARYQKSAESEEQLILLLNIPRIINLKYQSKYSSDLDKIIKRKTKLLEEQREFLKKKLMAKKKRMLEAQKIEALKKSIGQKPVQKKEKGLKEGQNSSVKEQIPLEKKDPQIINATEMKSIDAQLSAAISEKNEITPPKMSRKDFDQQESIVIQMPDETINLESDEDILNFLENTEMDYKAEKEKIPRMPIDNVIKETAYDMNEIQKSALGEVGNICTGNAANALSTMLDKVVKITIPTTDIVFTKDVVDILGSSEQKCVGVYIDITGDISLLMMLIFDKLNALRLADTLMSVQRSDEEIEKVEELNPMVQSALLEVGNILGSHYLTALSNMTGMELLPSVPSISYDMLGALLDSIIVRLTETSDIAVILNTIFYIEDFKINGYFLIFPFPNSITEIFDKLGLN